MHTQPCGFVRHDAAVRIRHDGYALAHDRPRSPHEKAAETIPPLACGSLTLRTISSPHYDPRDRIAHRASPSCHTIFTASAPSAVRRRRDRNATLRSTLRRLRGSRIPRDDVIGFGRHGDPVPTWALLWVSTRRRTSGEKKSLRSCKRRLGRPRRPSVSAKPEPRRRWLRSPSSQAGRAPCPPLHS